MPLKLPQNSLRWIIGALLLVFVIHQFSGARGFYALYNLQRSTISMQESIEHKNEIIDSLKLVEKRLETDPIYIERVARELLGVSRPGETVIKFVDRK